MSEQITNGIATEGTSLVSADLEALNAARNEARIRRINAEHRHLADALL